MVSILALWLPILVATVLVFAASSIIHMFLGYHKSDFAKIEAEDEVLDGLRAANIPPGDYFLPYAGSMEVMNSPEYRAKLAKGPAAFVTAVDPAKMASMGKTLVEWFVYCAVVGVFVAYASGRMLGPGAAYLEVFRLSGTVAFCCYALALPPRSIWLHQKWSTTLKSTFDGLIYAVLTAGSFGWLWPG